MKVTKFVHSCLLVETPERVVLFDPGAMSASSLDVSIIERLDDIFITHNHPDHLDEDLLKQFLDKFPNVRITSTAEVVDKLAEANITASTEAPVGVSFFDAPHENVVPVYPQPSEIGIHYLDTLTHPGDSHSFTETKAVLALPVTAPWGSSVTAVNLALELKPQFILPIHDWHWRDEARTSTYDMYEKLFADQGIKFFKLETGVTVDIEL